jgi:hypothetical protein
MYSYNLTSIKSIIAPLGIPWHKNKGQEFLDTFVYLGFHWDLPNKTIVTVWHATTVAGFGRFRSDHVTLGSQSCSRVTTCHPYHAIQCFARALGHSLSHSQLFQ